MPSMPSMPSRLALAALLGSWLACAHTDFSPSSNISTWKQSEWSLTASKFIPGQYQARVSLANGCVPLNRLRS
jgi:hypothetical protein